MKRFFFPLVFLIAAIGFLFGGSVGATYFGRPIIQNQENYTYYTANSSPEEHQLQPETFLVRTFTDPVAFYTLGLFVFTLVLAISTVGLWWQTRKLALGAEQQSKDMRASIDEAARAAVAMESVAESMKINADKIVESVGISQSIANQQKLVSEMQLRAYISVIIGSAFYQDEKLKTIFEAKPLMVNSGHTPAHKVVAMIKAAILPSLLPNNYVFEDIPELDGVKENMIPPQQNRIMSAFLEKEVPTEDVDRIMRGDGHSLYAWGYITYEDAFGARRRTDFCQRLTFLRKLDESGYEIMGYYIPGYNKAT
ncbi:MAG: hypothetical protein ABI230_00085 [Aestuariivirga sp.]